MSTALPKTFLTEEEYFALEEVAEFKSEYHDGEMFAMSGGSFEHSVISTNVTTKLQNRLGGSTCRILNAEMRVHVPNTRLYVYPDATVLCGKPRFATKNRTTIVNPTLIVEVLSPSTERYDRTTKFWDYQRLETLQDYVLVTQDAPQVERFSRQTGGSATDPWIYVSYIGLESNLWLPSLKLEIPLREIYEDIDFGAVLGEADERSQDPSDS